jgi:hypothetical protein
MKKYLILGHLGLGDHILCNGIYRHFSKISQKVVIPVKKHNLHSLQMMLLDRSNVEFFVVKDTNNLKEISESINLIFGNTHEIIKLGYFGESFLTTANINYDENFYLQAGVPFTNRWDDFEFSINQKNAAEICDITSVTTKYDFVHDDKERNFEIKENYLDSKRLRIKPNSMKKDLYSIFDYYPLIRQATEIHCIESSFAAFIDSIQINGSLFCHRYARPEPYQNKLIANTFGKDWIILQ